MTRILTVTIALFACVATAHADRACLEPLPALPVAIANNAVTSVDNGDGTWTLYSFMGITNPLSPSTITAASFRLDWPGGEWTPIANAPLLNGRAKIGSNAVTVGTRVFLIGGYTVSGGETTEFRLFEYVRANDDYVEHARVPIQVDDTVVGVYRDRWIYLVSGWHGPINSNVRNVQVYDTQDDAWAQATMIPGPAPGLFGHAGTVVGDRIVYMDGTKISGGFVINDRVFVGHIDPDDEGDVTRVDWTEVDAHPGAPTYRAASSEGAMPDGRLLVAGGTDNPYNFNGTGYNGQPAWPLDQVLAYDLVDDAWELLTIVADGSPTMDHRGLVRVGNAWATLGGMTGPGTSTDAVTMYTIVAGDGHRADFDCDDDVGVLDLLYLLAAWGACAKSPERCPADINDDGVVGFADLVVLLGTWGKLP